MRTIPLQTCLVETAVFNSPVKIYLEVIIYLQCLKGLWLYVFAHGLMHW